MPSWTTPQRQRTRAERERIAREDSQEALLRPAFEPAPQTEFEQALAQAIIGSADMLHSSLVGNSTPQAQVVAARALYAAEANALYTTIQAEYAASPRDLSA